MVDMIANNENVNCLWSDSKKMFSLRLYAGSVVDWLR